MDVVVQHRGQKIVRQAQGVKVSGKVQVDVFHGNHLGQTSSGGAAFHAETGSQGGFAQADQRLFAQAVERVSQPHHGGGLALSGRGGRNGRHQDEFPLAAVLRAQGVRRQLGLVVAVGFQMVLWNPEFLSGQVHHFFQLGSAGDLEVGIQG